MPRRQLHEFSTTGMDSDFLFFFSLSSARVFTLPRTDLSRMAYMRRSRGPGSSLSLGLRGIPLEGSVIRISFRGKVTYLKNDKPLNCVSLFKSV